MLPEKYRLKRDRDFEILFNEGRFFAGTMVNAKVWLVDPEKYPKRGYARTDLKIGFIVSVKTEKSAVKRNRVKRRIREIIRLFLKENRIRPGYHIAFMAKSESIGAPYADIEESVREVLHKARILS